MDRRGASTSIYNTEKWSKWRTGHFDINHIKHYCNKIEFIGLTRDTVVIRH
jgi:hypothetical protein